MPKRLTVQVTDEQHNLLTDHVDDGETRHSNISELLRAGAMTVINNTNTGDDKDTTEDSTDTDADTDIILEELDTLRALVNDLDTEVKAARQETISETQLDALVREAIIDEIFRSGHLDNFLHAWDTGGSYHPGDPEYDIDHSQEYQNYPDNDRQEDQ